MKIKQIIIGSFITLLGLTSCEEDTWYCDKGDGYTTDRIDTPAPFTAIDIDVRADTHIKQGDYFEVRVQASGNIINNIKTSVSGGVLEVYNQEGCVSENNGKIQIFITSPFYERITLNNSGTLENSGYLDLNDLFLKVNSSADVNLDNVALDDYEIIMNGSGDVRLQGATADRANIVMNSSGDLNLSNLFTNSMDILMKGSGEARVNVNAELDVTIPGSGKLVYIGNPNIISNVTGSGSIYHKIE